MLNACIADELKLSGATSARMGLVSPWPPSVDARNAMPACCLVPFIVRCLLPAEGRVRSCRPSPMTSDPAAAAALLPALSVYGCSSRNACKQVRQAIGRAQYGLEAYEDARVELSKVMPTPVQCCRRTAVGRLAS